MAEWFCVKELAPGTFLLQEPGHVQCFLICGRERAALIDSGLGLADIGSVVSKLTALPVQVLNTHWHYDHIGGNPCFDTVGISESESSLISETLESPWLRTIYIDFCLAEGLSFPDNFDPDQYRIKGCVPDKILLEGDWIDLGGRKLKVLATPGHTKGSLSYLDSSTRGLFCGDFILDNTLCAQFSDSDLEAYQASLDRVLSMPVSRFYSAHHDPVLPMSIAKEALDLMGRVIRKETRPMTLRKWKDPVLYHPGNELGVLTPMPGTTGIDLAELNKEVMNGRPDDPTR